jgi:hypothetical protein
MRSPEPADGERRRDWSPGFWERMDAPAGAVDIEAPARLPSSGHRYAFFDREDAPPAGTPIRDSRRS